MENFTTKAEAKASLDAHQGFFDGILAGVEVEKCAGMDSQSVVVCLNSTRNVEKYGLPKGRVTCFNDAQVAAFFAANSTGHGTTRVRL
jgi:hypothetical protein